MRLFFLAQLCATIEEAEDAPSMVQCMNAFTTSVCLGLCDIQSERWYQRQLQVRDCEPD